jgi:hypothetical protein
VSTHTCPKEGCQAQVPQHQLACRRHWARVSAPTQREVYAAYRSGDTDRHWAAMDAAIAEMNR